MEIRTAEFIPNTDKNIVEGYAIVYGSPSEVLLNPVKGAFKEMRQSYPTTSNSRYSRATGLNAQRSPLFFSNISTSQTETVVISSSFSNSSLSTAESTKLFASSGEIIL